MQETPEEIYIRSFDAWVEAFTIFSKYQGKKSAHVATEHDCIWAGPDEDVEITSEDKVRLKVLGWSFEDGCGFKKFV